MLIADSTANKIAPFEGMDLSNHEHDKESSGNPMLLEDIQIYPVFCQDLAYVCSGKIIKACFLNRFGYICSLNIHVHVS
jgi:hypothetical protein